MPGPVTTMEARGDTAIFGRGQGPGEAKAPPTIGEVWTASREYQAPHNTNWEDIVFDEEFAPLLAEINRRRKARGELALLPPSWGKAPDNRLRKQVGPNAYGVTGRTVGRREAAAGILAEVERERDFDPQAFAGIDTDVDKFMAPRFAKEKAKRAKAGETLDRASGVVATGASFFGGMTKAFEDPLNLATLPVGGGGRTFAARVLSAGGANAGVEFLSTPTQRRNLSLLGEDLTTADAARNIAMAGVGGALFQGGAEGVARAGGFVFDKAAERMPLDWRLAQQLKREVPVQLRTPEQQAAIHVVERGAEIDATSPWRPTHQALDAHAERLQDTMERLNAPDPAPARPAAVAAPQAPRPAATAPSSAAAGPRVAGGFEMGRYMARNRVAESGGNDRARPIDPATGRRQSSALGRYQFLDQTWINTYRAEFGKTGESNEQILAKRTDGALQDRLMARFTRDNIKMMERAGVPVTDGTVYLAHFLGPADAIKVLKAAPDTPVRGLVSGASIGANPAVFGKINSTGQLVGWAQRKMAQDPGAVPAGTGAPDVAEPIVRPAELDADPVVAEAPVLDVDPDVMAPALMGAVRQIAADRGGRSLNDTARIAAELDVDEAQLLGVYDRLVGMGELRRLKNGNYRRVAAPADTGPEDMLLFLARRGGLSPDGFSERQRFRNLNMDNPPRGHDLVNSGNLNKFVPRGGPLVRKGGLGLDEAGELLHDYGFFGPVESAVRPTESELITLLDDVIRRGEKRYSFGDTAPDVRPTKDSPAKAGWQSEAHYEQERGQWREAALRVLGRDLDETEFGKALQLKIEDWHSPVDFLDLTEDDWLAGKHLDVHVARMVNREIDDVLEDAFLEIEDPYYDFEISAADAFAREAGRAGEGGEGSAPVGRNPGEGEPGAGNGAGADQGGLDPAARDAAEAAGELGPPQFDPAAHQAFDDPAGDGLTQASDSLWHDIRNTADPAMTVDLDDGRGARPIGDIEAELDADDAAIRAIRDCL